MSTTDEEFDYRLHDLELLAERLRCSIMAILSHAIRRQHLPEGMTFDSELWDRLRDLGGEEACTAVSDDIQRTQALLRRGEPVSDTDTG